MMMGVVCSIVYRVGVCLVCARGGGREALDGGANRLEGWGWRLEGVACVLRWLLWRGIGRVGWRRKDASSDGCWKKRCWQRGE